VHTIGNQLIEAIRLHEKISKKEAAQKAIDRLAEVGVPNPTNRMNMYSWELSGGLRQRAMIAMALSCRPALLIADEPTTALDVTIQAQILHLMRQLQAELGMAILLITHDLGVVAQMGHEVAVMYLGRIVEFAAVEDIFASPQHPYTQALLRSLPGTHVGERKTELEVIEGSVPDPFERLPGCPFHPRCREAEAGLCDAGAPPPLVTVAPGHTAACHKRRPDGDAAPGTEATDG
jgi:peptide/nickel transport system ATP-binding protein